MPNLATFLWLLLGIGILLIVWPRFGFLHQFRRMRARSRRMLVEDALKLLHTAELEDQRLSLQALAGALDISANRASQLLASMQSDQLIQLHNKHVQLSDHGRQLASQILRAHRLWESYLAEKTGFGAGEWHSLAERKEHHLTPEETDRISSALGFPKFDPHGDPIPGDFDQAQQAEIVPIASLSPGQHAHIAHIEDEPPSVAQQLRAEELAPGMLLQLIARNDHRITFQANGESHILAPIVAANLFVTPIAGEAQEPLAGFQRLSKLEPGGLAEVVNISPACRGAERRRLLDLGILPGTSISAEMVSPGGDPTAYRIRGALIALRDKQAKHIYVRALENTSE